MRWLQLALNVRDAQVRAATHPDSPEALEGFHLHLLRLLDAVQEELDALPLHGAPLHREEVSEEVEEVMVEKIAGVVRTGPEY
jgi:hypothetical protein